jgi:hypothetical protein
MVFENYVARAFLRVLCAFAPLREPPPELGSQSRARRKGAAIYFSTTINASLTWVRIMDAGSGEFIAFGVTI